jgi:imidazolonepropionase-like amidohydrolase
MNKMKGLKILLIILVGFMGANAQNNTTIITNAIIHVGNGEVIEKGVLVMENGIIKEVGLKLKNLYKNARIIDAAGKHLYPALIGMNNIMGLNEIDAVRATRDYNEQGEFNPNVRAIIAYNTDSKILPTAMVNGILYTQVVPQGGIISGSSSLMKIKADNWEDAAVKTDEGVHLNWPVVSYSKNGEASAGEQQIKALITFLYQANQYILLDNPIFNARLEAMRKVLKGSSNLYIHANDAKSILRAIKFFKQNYPQIKLVLVGATDAYLLKEELIGSKIPIVLGNIHRLPSRNAEAIDQPYMTPGQLNSAGIQLAISNEGSWESRNLAYIAGTASAYGLDREEALKSISLTPAKLMGVDNILGSLEEGKIASLLIVNGDLLDMKSSSISMAFLEGTELDLKNDQVKLYEKYLQKFEK